MIIAVDFDGTLCESRWPDIGPPNNAVIDYLRKRQENGDQLILWTCREGEMLDRAVMWSMNRGLIFDAVNRNLPERIAEYGTDPRKIGADEYWDDRAVIVRSAGFGDSEIITPEMDVMLCERIRKGGIRERIKSFFRKEE